MTSLTRTRLRRAVRIIYNGARENNRTRTLGRVWKGRNQRKSLRVRVRVRVMIRVRVRKLEAQAAVVVRWFKVGEERVSKLEAQAAVVADVVRRGKGDAS